MSYNNPYRKLQDDFSTNSDAYTDSQRMYHRESSAYRSRIGTASSGQTRSALSSSSSELSAPPPGKALNFLHSCGLDVEDLQTLAELPEHLMTAETLPELLVEIKKKKAASVSSSRSRTLQPSSSGRSWGDRSHAQPAEYPLPVRQSYSHHQDQVQTWDKQWESDQPTPTYSSSGSSYVVEYNHLKEKKNYFDKVSYTTESSGQKSSDLSQSYSTYSRDISQPSYLSSRDVGQPSHQSSRDVRIPSLLSGIDIGKPSHLSSRDAGLPSLLTCGNVSQPAHLSSRNVGQPSFLYSRDVGQPSPRSSRDVGQPSRLSSRDVGQPSPRSSRDVGQPSRLSSRDVGQPSRLSSRDVGQPSHQWRAEDVHRVPSRKEASDFHGRTPPVFPYACVLCDITVLSDRDWSVHIKGAQHANSQLSLVERYPEWDQTIRSARRNESLPEPSRSTQKRDETTGSRNGFSGSKSRLSSSKSESSDSKNSDNMNKTEQKDKCKMVCVKFEVDEVDEPYLKKLLGQFGAIVKLIMFSRMAFAEMGSADQAADVVKYFLHNPLRVRGKLLDFSLSAACSFIQNSCVVSFSSLPAGEGIHSELTAIARRFGSVKHSLFLPGRGYVEMTNAEEASKLVEHYSTNSLKLKGKSIHVSISAEYQTLGETDADREESATSISHNKRRRSSSARRTSRSSRKDSPSPKRRTSAEKSKSRRRSSSRTRDELQRSKKRSRESSRQDRSSTSKSRKSSSEDQSKRTEESVKQKTEDKKDQSDSDLEGVAVIADDCDELNSEDEEFIEVYHDDDDDQDSSAALTDQEMSEDMQNLEDSDDNAIPSNTDLTNINSESDLNASDGSSECKKTQELQQNQELLNNKTLDISDASSDCKEAKQLQQNKEAPNDKSVETSDASADGKEAQELHQNPEAPNDKSVETSDASADGKEAQELHQNPEAPNDKSVETSDASADGKEAQELHQNPEAPNDKSVETSDASADGKEAQELHQNPEAPNDKSVEITGGSSECNEAKELQQNQEMQQDKTLTTSDGSSDYKEALELPQNEEVQHNNIVSVKQEVNLGNCVTVDELREEKTEQADKQDFLSTEEKYGKVLEVKGFPLAKKYTEADLLNIGQKCGEVAACCLLRNSRKVEKALIEMVNAADASTLEAESKKQNFKLGGKILKLTVSDRYTQAKERVSTESDSGQTEEEKHVEVSRSDTSCQEMLAGASEDEAQRETSVDTIIQTSSNEDGTSGETDRDESKTQNDCDQLSSQTSQNLNESWDDNEGVKQVSASNDGTETFEENSDSVSEMPTHLNDPVGTEFVRPVVGYFCSLCHVIYASEEEAKDGHCRTASHHQKLKEQNSSTQTR